jgi:uncharacterized membrane protein YdjX (TVP38/TMEM64 family)
MAGRSVFQPMNSSDEPKPTPDPGPAAPFERLERTLRADVEEARAIEPLIEGADGVFTRIRRVLWQVAPLLALLALGAVLVVSGLYRELTVDNLAVHHDDLRDWVDTHPVLATMGVLGTLALIVSTGLPGGAVLVVASGFLFGVLPGTVVAVVGAAVGASVLYFAARRVFELGGREPALSTRIRDGFARSPVSFAFFIRLVPVFPFGAASVALAWAGCRPLLFLAATSLGNIPSSLVYTAIGAGLDRTLAEHGTVSLSLLAQPRFLLPLAALAMLALLPVLLGLRRRRQAGKA